ncbi:MAG: hypothetical protein AAB364_01930 [Patescibacteria group bacterium]
MAAWQILVWSLMGCQMIGWAWFTCKGGKLSHRQFMIFSFSMFAGQAGTIWEAYMNASWGTIVAQAYFFLFTAYGVYRRWRESRFPVLHPPPRVDPAHA